MKLEVSNTYDALEYFIEDILGKTIADVKKETKATSADIKKGSEDTLKFITNFYGYTCSVGEPKMVVEMEPVGEAESIVSKEIGSGGVLSQGDIEAVVNTPPTLEPSDFEHGEEIVPDEESDSPFKRSELN